MEDKEHSPSNEQLDLLGGLDPSNDEGFNLIGSFSIDSDTSMMALENSSNSKPVPEMLLIIDTETTGLDHEKDSCIEVGSILFNVPNRAVIAQQSFLLPVEDNNAQLINRIPASITRLDQSWREGLSYLQSLIDAAEVIVAHNASFDQKWFGKEPLPEVSKPWLCTMEDINWPSELQIRARPSVRDLALAYEVPVWSAHRALTDCIYLAEVFRRCDDLETLLIKGLEPRSLMRAKVSYEQRKLAKDAGFTWNHPVAGAWTRRMSEREIRDLDFSVVPVDVDRVN